MSILHFVFFCSHVSDLRLNYLQFHQNLYHSDEKPLLRNMTAEEKVRFDKAEQELNSEREKIELDEKVNRESEQISPVGPN